MQRVGLIERYRDRLPFAESDPLITLGFLAGQTRNVELGLLVTGVTYRHPGLLVKTATTLDVLLRQWPTDLLALQRVLVLLTAMPSVGRRAHAGASTRSLVTSTTHARQLPSPR